MGMKTAVIYARFSCSKQREASIKDQLRVCKEWCAREGYVVVGEYCDEAMSGRTDDRPAFQRMVANAGESDICLVYMMDRFSRDIYDAPIYKKRLRDKGVKVVSATEAMPDGPEAMIIESVYEAMAAMESAHTSKRVRRGMEGNALKCMHNGVPLYGYDRGEDGFYSVNEDEAAIVRECFSRKAAGEAVGHIASDLARRGVRPSKSRQASYGFVYNMLKNEKYTGIYIWGDVRVEGGMPAIVTREEFEMARAAIPRKQRANEQWGDFFLSGKAMCGHCLRNLVGTSGHGRGGTKYEYYKCSNCHDLKPVRSDWLESSVVDALRDLLSDRDEAMRVARVIEARSKDRDADRRLAKAKRRKREAEEGADNLMAAVAKGLDYERAKAKIDELDAVALAADREIAILSTVSEFDAEDFADFLQFGATLDDRRLLEAFVWQVMVGNEDVIVTLNYDVRENEAARLRVVRGSQNLGAGSGKSAKKSPNRLLPAEAPVRTDSTWWTGRGSNPGPWD